MRDLMQNYIQEHPNASEAEKLAYAGVVAKLLNAREHAKKAPMIRSLIEQREQELRQMETRPEQSAVNEPATDASRMAESALQLVIRKVRVARENAQDTPGAPREAKRSIECDDEDYDLDRKLDESNFDTPDELIATKNAFKEVAVAYCKEQGIRMADGSQKEREKERSAAEKELNAERKSFVLSQ